MPFIAAQRRLDIQNDLLKPRDFVPGDLCYLYYKTLVDAWKAEPRWTTAHNLFKKMLYEDLSVPQSSDHVTAMQLAWQVFFIKYVMPYEDKKEAENGTI